MNKEVNCCFLDLAGSEVQQFCGLVVLWRSALRDAHWSVSIPRP